MKKLMKLMISASFLTVLLSCAGLGITEPEPTAVIVDADTGKPIEGAVAFAVWKVVEGEGVPFARRIEESVSDSMGRVYIPDLWDWHLIESARPVMSVYKCGYILWNQKSIYVQERNRWRIERKDFDRRHMLIRLKKWPGDFSFVKHSQFIRYASGSGYGAFKTEHFGKAFQECEAQKRSDEYYGK